MPFLFEATTDYFKSENRITILLKFAKQEGIWGNDENRNLFLKLGVVLIVTQFQVFVEKVLAEYQYEIRHCNRTNQHLPLHQRLQSLKLHIEEIKLHQVLMNHTTYDINKLNSVRTLVESVQDLCDDHQTIPAHLKIIKKYPMGRQGLNELKDLFKQIEGKDIFDNAKFDINKLNEILNRRHNIIHEDANDQLTEVTVKEYKEFIAKVVKHINKYMDANLKRIKKES